MAGVNMKPLGKRHLLIKQLAVDGYENDQASFFRHYIGQRITYAKAWQAFCVGYQCKQDGITDYTVMNARLGQKGLL
jgi:hypothetical protein